MEDFKDLKVGDSVWTIQEEDTEIIQINYNSSYPIKTKMYSYTLDGFQLNFHKHRSLFCSNPFEKKEDFEPRWMIVSDNNESWHKRFVFMIKNNFYISWFSVEDDEGVAKQVSTVHWKYAKEMEEIEQIELTIEEIAEKFGLCAEQIKIKK
ncbi:hypothetical protein OX284_010045 [Flavobacterium sp. SUN046]|uniref:hypothetical protein n=1 Tax=Flavobacterium sp. SUN046 TaxID=3002440 RepID=UPI002DBFA870|nr:hypothetical protein [Flavobacterium sp. SUN046]MEC4049768.1 hypothetical protein [Flavobacterium sp. SUN046]